MSEVSDPRIADLMALLYQELRGVARRTLRERSGAGPQVTSLVHECYERLSRTNADQYEDRSHFLATAGRAMRFIVADRARHASRDKRGGGWSRVSVEGLTSLGSTVSLVALDQALTRLEAADPTCAEITCMRLLGGMTVAECAAAAGMSRRSVDREWRAGRAFLVNALKG